MALHRRTKTSAFLVIMIVLIVVVLEIIVRAGMFLFPDSNLRKLILVWHQQGTMTAYNEAASFVRFIPNRQSPDISAYGFHSPDVPFEKPVGTRRIAFIGGSTTFDSGPIENTYPHLVNGFLRRSGFDTDYINAGVGAYTSIESLINYHLRVSPWKPDLVVFYNARNDLLVSGNCLYMEKDMTRLLQPPYYDFPPRWHRILSRFSTLYALMMELFGVHSFRKNNWDWRSRHNSAYAQELGRPETVDEFMENVRTERVLDVYRRNVEALAGMTGASGVALLLVGYDFHPDKIASVSIPKDRTLNAREKQYLGNMIVKMNRIQEEVADRFPGTYFVNLHGRISRSTFYDDCHLSMAGKNQKSRIISEFIVQHWSDFGW
jgi:hypothetical protein